MIIHSYILKYNIGFRNYIVVPDYVNKSINDLWSNACAYNRELMPHKVPFGGPVFEQPETCCVEVHHTLQDLIHDMYVC